MEPAPKVEDAVVADKIRIFSAVILGFYLGAAGQELPPDELQINLSGYFDTFDVNVLYPSFSLTSKVSDNTSITGRYLVDMITAASMKSGSASIGEGEDDDRGEHDDFDRALNKTGSTNGVNSVDAVSAASAGGGGESFGPSFDDLRNEYNLGVTHLFQDNLLSINGIYSSERDYTSATVAGTISRQFAMKNTTLELGFVRSWDHIFPVTKDWTKTKDVITYSANFSQILGPNALIQFLTSYTENSGYLADAYNQVSVDSLNTLVFQDPVHPNSRIRRAAASRFKLRLSEISSIELGYRYYWDDWDVVSNTISVDYKKHTGKHTILGLGWRGYLQNRANFFKSNYTLNNILKTSDVKLDKGYSNEFQLELTLNGGRGMDYLPFLTNERVQYNLSLTIYQRHTQTGYWFNGSKDLIASNFNIGLRYRF